MALLDIIKGRRSIREFKKKEIPEDVIEKLIDAIIWAPSAGNLQSRYFYFVFNADIKKRLVRAALDQSFIASAPLSVVGCCDYRISQRYGTRGKELYTIQDVAVSIQNLMLAAHEQGLGSVWVGAFREDEVAEILDIPAHLRPVVIVPVGYPAEKPLPPQRVSREKAIKIIT
ncbi:MAG: nitroreductase family protein [Nitrospinae bacterium]|nr:nitroreductase family protein [Nitrospinota bacterium]